MNGATASRMKASAMDDWKNRKIFTDYVWSFYGPGEVYGDFFDNTLTRQELDDAVHRRMSIDSPEFCGDSIDRELVRDIMLAARGVSGTEHDVSRVFA